MVQLHESKIILKYKTKIFLNSMGPYIEIKND